MGIFGFGKKKDKLDKDVKQIFEKINDQLTAQQITDQAISYRNLKQYDKAKSLLKEAIGKHNYLPAKTILGTTLAKEGKIDEAEKQFKRIITAHSNANDYALIEVYANLGSLYHNYRKDDKTALKYYELALNAPMPKAYGVSEKGEMGYGLMVSNVYLDLCIIHFYRKEFSLAQEYAFKRLQTVKDCPSAARVYGCCLFFELLKNSIDIDQDTENRDIENIVKYLQIAIESNPKDFPIVAYTAMALFCMQQICFYKKNTTLRKELEKEENEYAQHLKKYSEQFSEAIPAYQMYADYIASFVAQVERPAKQIGATEFICLLNQKAKERNILCPNCHKPDIFLGLRDSCLECGHPFSKRNKVESLQFALEILSLFLQNFDEAISADNKRALISFFSELIGSYTNKGNLPENDKITALKDIVNCMGTIGGNKFGGALTCKKGENPRIQIAQNFSGDQDGLVKTIGATSWAIQFMLDL